MTLNTLSLNNISLLIFILQLTFISFSKSQECTCQLYEKNSVVLNEALSLADKTKFDNIAKELLTSGNEFCQFTYHLINAEYKVKNREFETWDKDIVRIESLRSKLNCPESEFDILALKTEYFQESDQIELATKTAYEMLHKAEDEKNATRACSAASLLSAIYWRQDDDEKALSFIPQVVKFANQIKEEKELPKFYNWLARGYESVYAVEENKIYLDSADIYADKALLTGRKLHMNFQIKAAFQTKEAIAYHRGDFKKSLRLHDSIYYYIQKSGSAAQLPMYFQMKAYTLQELGLKQKAAEHQDSAILYARKYSQPSYLANFLKTGIDIFEDAGMTQKAMNSLKEYVVIKDSVQTAKRTAIISELQQKYEKEKDSGRILELTNQRYLLWGGIGLLTVLSGLIYFIYRNRIMKRDQLILETEQRLNRARMNPHFFFNALASLQSFAINETDSMAIAENLSKFSHIMRETLENTYREYNSIQQETDFMTEYLELQQMRFPEKFTFEILNSVSDSDSILIPSMIVQPFVENSVEHGFANIDYKGFIKLEFSQVGENTVVKISDNGRGLGHQSSKSKPYISRASQIIKDRIYLLNLKLKTNAQFSIQNNDQSGQGVNVLITLPEIYDHENLSNRQ
jgi:hypothetical protein